MIQNIQVFILDCVCTSYNMSGRVVSDIQPRAEDVSLYTAISIKVVPRAKRKSRIRARKAAGNR